MSRYLKRYPGIRESRSAPTGPTPLYLNIYLVGRGRWAEGGTGGEHDSRPPHFTISPDRASRITVTTPFPSGVER